MIRSLIFGVLFFIQITSFGQSVDTVNVLFAGNSYTYFWNLPQVVAALATSQDHIFVTRQSTAGGANLGHHWKGERNLNTRQKIKSSSWDYVVLQDHSLRTIEAIDSLNLYVSKWKNEIESTGARPILYMTWAREFNPLMINDISKGYEDIAKSLDIPVVPIGKIWDKARSLRPEIPLYDPDGSHPSPLGTYLTACAFYQVLSGDPAKDLPTRLLSEDEYGEKIYLSIVSSSDAIFCQDVVRDVLENYNLSNISN